MLPHLLPAHDGYVFTGWNGSLVNVTENRTVTAEYSLLGDVDGDGVVTSADALTVLRMSRDYCNARFRQP